MTTDAVSAPRVRIDSSTSVDGLMITLADGVLSITMNRPDSLNSLTEAMLSGIADAVERAADDDRVRVVRLGGAGRGFSSGAGIGEEDQKGGGTSSPTKIIDEANRAVRALTALPKPAVAVVHGPAAGVAASLALGCDVVLASENAFFMLAFTKIGLMPDGGASALVAAAVGRIRAMRMALLAERIPAREALDWGSGHRGLSRRRVRAPRSTRSRRRWSTGPRWRSARPSRPSTPPRSPNSRTRSNARSKASRC